MDKAWPRKALVTKIYSAAFAVDLIYLSDRASAEKVPIMLGSPISSNTGLVDLPVPAGDETTGYTGVRDMTAIVDQVDGDPVVIGFLHQRVSQILFDDDERRISRHASDVYTSIDADGNVELAHPSGTFMRIGTPEVHEDLTGANHDGNWAIAKNTGKSVHFNLEVWNSGQQRAQIHIDTSGNLKIIANGNVDITTLLATLNGDLQVNGSIAATGDVADGTSTMQSMRDTYNAHGSGAPAHPPNDM